MISINTILLLLVTATVSAAVGKDNYELRKAQFLNAMRSSSIPKAPPRNSSAIRQRRLIMEKAIPFRRQLDQQYDDAAAANYDDGQQQQQQYDDDMVLNYGFNMREYSLKYAGCSAIKTFSDDLAEDEDATTVFRTDQYIVFRLCPSSSCDGSQSYGCMSDYGEYMLPLADWLETMQPYREEELERYCEYCSNCNGAADYYNNNNDDAADENNDDDENNGEEMYYYNNNADGNQNGDAYYDIEDDGAAAQQDDANDDANDDGGRRRRHRRYLEEENANDDDGQEQQQEEQDYCSQCSNYGDVCNNDGGDDYSGFFNCVQINVNDDLSLYIGPHCASDKTTLLLALFDDDECSNYVGDQYDINTITNLDITSETLMQYYNGDCIACQQSELAFQEYDDGQEEDDSVTEVCETLYGEAAKCNIHLSGATSDSYQTTEQAYGKYAVCNFIKSVVTGAYDETGFIYFDINAYTSDNEYNEFASNLWSNPMISKTQVFTILVFSMTTLILMMYCCVLHKSIQTKQNANGGRSKHLLAASKGKGGPEVKRQNSGIMMCRSDGTDPNEGSAAPYQAGGGVGGGTMA